MFFCNPDGYVNIQSIEFTFDCKDCASEANIYYRFDLESLGIYIRNKYHYYYTLIPVYLNDVFDGTEYILLLFLAFVVLRYTIIQLY